METKKIWITCIIALLVSGTAVAIVAMGVDHYKKLSMATDVETDSSSSEPIIVANESIEKSEEIGFGHPLTEEIEVVQEEAIKIALNDSRVQELIKGKEYQVLGVGGVPGRIESADMVALGLGVGEKVYTIWVDMKNQTVTSVEEQSSVRIEDLDLKIGEN
ncbi:MAG: hypothetical protein U9N41_05510 [Euryarchaeota archaeon]|nr:hypothetical protein [Euryarchaeota archaeon]